MGFRPLRHGFWLLAASTVGLALAGGIAYATIPDSGQVIHTCYKPTDATKPGGAVLNVVDSESGATCKAGDTALKFNQQGPPGPPGPAGPQGDRGPQGPAGVSEGAFLSTGFFQVVNLGSNYTEIARMPLGVGKWLVSASFSLRNFDSSWVPSGCSLGTSLNADQERGDTDLGALGTGGSTQRVAISEAADFTQPAAVTLGCYANVSAPNVIAFHTQITATRLDNLAVARTSQP